MAADKQTQGKFQPGNQSQGRQKKGDTVNGILLIDKPQGLSSNQALQRVKRLFNAKKAGHTGSLDPIATGLLPLCFGHATRIAEMYLNSDKCYDVRIRLGVNTASGDREGEIVSKSTVDVSSENIRAAIEKFKGQIEQVPPMYSALKHKGQPLYKLARQGVEIERKPRLVTVREISITGFQGELLDIRVACSKGFYIRSLAIDIGKALGCGGHVEKLRRTAAGPFTIDQGTTLDQLEALESPQARQALLFPIDYALGHLPKIDLSLMQTEVICHGQSIRAPNLPVAGMVRLYSGENHLLGLGEASADSIVVPKKLFI